MAKKKRRSYDDKFRAGAVVTLEAAGYPNTPGALTRIANELKVPPRTLSRWFNGENNPPPDNIVSEKKVEFTELLKTEIEGVLGDMSDARQDATYRDMGTVLGILVDKLQLLQGKPTEHVKYEQDVTELTDDDLERIARGKGSSRKRTAGTA